MHVPTDLKQKVDICVQETVAKIEQLYGKKFPGSVKVLYDINSARLGGQALLQKNTIRLNPAFLRKYREDYIKRTVVHEVAHLGVFQVYMCGGHGWEWKNMMMRLGADPSRCHSYEPDVGQGRQLEKFAYACSHCGKPYPVGNKVHQKLQNGAHYWGKCCGQRSRLVYQGGSLGAVPRQIAAKMIADNNIPAIPPASTNNKKLNAPSPSSKLGQCYALYKKKKYAGNNRSRAYWINVFVQECDCTPAGASTYVNTCKRLWEQGV